MEEGNVVGLPRPGGSVGDDPLLAVFREGARRMLTHAIEAEVAAFLAGHAELVDGDGRRRLGSRMRSPRQLSLFVSDGFTCREQIAQATDRHALHAVQVLQMALRAGGGGPRREYPERGYLRLGA